MAELLEKWRIAARQVGLSDEARRGLEEVLAALERIPELERELAAARESVAWRHDWIKSAGPRLDRAERLEAAADEVLVALDESEAASRAVGVVLISKLRADLAAAPAEEMSADVQGAGQPEDGAAASIKESDVAADHPTPWRAGSKLGTGTHYGHVTVYDDHPDGDGGKPGRVIGFMEHAAAKQAIRAVNREALLADLVELQRYRDLSVDPGADRNDLRVALSATLRHVDAMGATVGTQNREMARRDADLERMTAGNEQVVREVRALLKVTEALLLEFRSDDAPLADAFPLLRKIVECRQ